MAITLIVGTNTYISLEDANNYFDLQYNTPLWASKTDDEKAKLLINATSRIDLENFAGTPTSNTQELKFPRSDLPLVDGIDYSDVIPKQIKNATCLLAYHLLTTDMNTIGKQNETIKGVKVGSIAVDFDTDDSSKNTSDYNELPPYVESYLNDFKIGGGATVFVYR